MIYRVTLSVNVEYRAGAGITKCVIPIFQITQGDHVWNTLIGDWEREGNLDCAPCIPYLQLCAEEFCRDYPTLLHFGSVKKAHQFAVEVLRRPVALRGNDYPVKYPGVS
jgi:hypothetical protein